MTRALLAAAVLLGAAAGAPARPGGRMVTEVYDAGRIYEVHAQVGRATLIQFEEDETLSGSQATALGIGDAAAWNIGVRQNNLVMKPVQRAAQTNVIVVTNKRTYAFELRMAGRDTRPVYVLRFRYPDTDATRSRGRAGAAAQAHPAAARINTDYTWRGANDALMPTAAWDDGRFTRLEYDHAGELPVFFKVLPDGTESLLNVTVDPRHRHAVQLQEVARQVRVRLGDQVGEVINRGYRRPAFNASGAGAAGQERVLIRNAEQGTP